MNMDLGDTRLIVSECMKQGLLRNQAAYVLATSYWETARTMKPVEEAYWLSDTWRKNNLHYYPWHGRGYVQTTWEKNYRRLKAESGVDVIEDPAKAMRPDVAVMALVVGCRDGWFTGKKLSDYITVKASNYRGARRVVNGTDKASAIAELAREYEKELIAEGYGVEPEAPVVNERRDGTPPRKNPVQSTTNISVATGGLAMVAQLSEQFKAAVSSVTDSFGVGPEFALTAVALAALGWIFRERIRKWAEGDR